MQYNTDRQDINLSVVVLGYCANDDLIPFVSHLSDVLKLHETKYQIVLVGNYWPNSNDKTPEVIRMLAEKDHHIKPVIKEKLGYMGWDMRSGLEVADGNYIAMIDGDGQMPAEDIIKVYDKIKNGGFDLVKTYRIKRYDENWRKFISFFYNLMFKILFPGLHARDMNSKPKIFTRDFYKKMNLRSDDWFADAEIMIEARRLRARICEVSTIFNKNENRKSFVKLSAIFEFIKNLITYRIREFYNNK